MLKKCGIALFPDEGCRWSTEILGNHGDNKRLEICTEKRWEYMNFVLEIISYMNTYDLLNNFLKAVFENSFTKKINSDAKYIVSTIDMTRC